MMLEIIGGFTVGILAHETRAILKRDFSGGWFPIMCYVVGVVVSLPVVAVIYMRLRDVDDMARLLAAYLLGFLSVGAGVVAGHYFHPDSDE